VGRGSIGRLLDILALFNHHLYVIFGHPSNLSHQKDRAGLPLEVIH